MPDQVTPEELQFGTKYRIVYQIPDVHQSLRVAVLVYSRRLGERLVFRGDVALRPVIMDLAWIKYIYNTRQTIGCYFDHFYQGRR